MQFLLHTRNWICTFFRTCWNRSIQIKIDRKRIERMWSVSIHSGTNRFYSHCALLSDKNETEVHFRFNRVIRNEMNQMKWRQTGAWRTWHVASRSFARVFLLGWRTWGSECHPEKRTVPSSRAKVFPSKSIISGMGVRLRNPSKCVCRIPQVCG